MIICNDNCSILYSSMSSSDDNESDIKKSTQGSFQPLEALGINIFQIKPNNRNNIRINRSRLNLGNKSSKLLTYRANKNSDLDLKVVANSNEATVRLRYNKIRIWIKLHQIKIWCASFVTCFYFIQTYLTVLYSREI